jgi:P pilus assembly chaperone PapD
MNRLVAAAALASLSTSFGALAKGGFAVHPVTVEVHGGLAAITVENEGDRRIYLTASVYDWSKTPDGKDVIAGSSEGFASPPAAWVPPHGAYTLRVKVPIPSGTAEGAYRLKIKQVPEAEDLAAGRIVFAVTQILPVFSLPDREQAPPDLHGVIIAGPALSISNAGGRHSRITEIRQGGRILRSHVLAYVLPGSSTLVGLESPAVQGSIQIVTDQGPKTIQVR